MEHFFWGMFVFDSNPVTNQTNYKWKTKGNKSCGFNLSMVLRDRVNWTLQAFYPVCGPAGSHWACVLSYKIFFCVCVCVVSETDSLMGYSPRVPTVWLWHLLCFSWAPCQQSINHSNNAEFGVLLFWVPTNFHFRNTMTLNPWILAFISGIAFTMSHFDPKPLMHYILQSSTVHC